MGVRAEFPCPVRVIQHEWIPMPDGCRLAARIWLPESAGREPVPTILEYVPYRKNDGLVLRDAPIHHYFAGHGYASVRVDIRGSGDSDGILEDEYLPLEQEDGVAVIRWLASRPWCSGKVGMIGKSWGGFNGLQVAALRPPELAAVISVASTDDRYADDVHYMGGCVLAWAMLPWASTMLAYNALPPTPRWSARRGGKPGGCGWSRPRRTSTRGWPISAVTSSGARDRSARTSRRSAARSSWWAAGPTPTATRSCGSWRATQGRARA